MNRAFPIRLLMAFFLVSFTIIKVTAQSNDKNIETVVHLLDYIARDYSEGVQNGEIVDADEYEEMLEFSSQAYDLTNQGSFLPVKELHLVDAISQLKTLIQEKKSANDVSNL